MRITDIQENILLKFSKVSGRDELLKEEAQINLDNALDELCRVFPSFLADVAGKSVLDFGCGMGYQSVAMAKNGAKKVTAMDINTKYLEHARILADEQGVADKMIFKVSLSKDLYGVHDMVISQNSMEHFNFPLDVLDQMSSALSDKGVIFITFGPPWLAPYGSHCQFFSRIPWMNILFKEEAVMRVRSRFRNDGAMKYEDVEGGLNKMTVSKFREMVNDRRLKIEHIKYDCVKKMDFLGKVPFLNELFINNVSCVLTKP